MRGSAAFRAGIAPGGALSGPWVRNPLWAAARAVPSLDLRFADNKSLVDATTGQNLVTFTRASSGTYVDSQGVIRTATTNLLLRSEELGTSPWSTASASVTANSVPAPNGTVTADTLVRSGTSSARVVQGVTVAGTNTLTVSVYAKAGTQNFLAIQINTDSNTKAAFITFDLTNGAAGASQTLLGVLSLTASQAVNVGDGWYRCACSFTGVGGADVYVGASSTANSRNGTDGGTIYIWGAQLEQSSTVGEYIPTTSTINSAPRFDHNPTTGESLGLLVEEQRTNLCLQSEDFSTTWGTTNYTVTTNATTAPNGTVTADKLIRNTTDTTTSVTQNVTVTANTAYNYSIFVKASEWSKVGLREGSVSGNYVTFDLSNGTIVSSSVATGAITAFANGWYRISMQMTTGAAQTTYGIRLIPLPNSYTSGTPSYSFAGDGTAGVFAWGAQLEAGAFPTSYIPTTAATATRSADVASITGTNFSSWYRQDEGTVFGEFSAAAYSTASLAISDGTNSNRIMIDRGSTGTRYVITNAGAAQTGGTQTPYVLNSFARSVIGFALDNCNLAVNGATQTVDTSVSIPSSVDRLLLGVNAGGSGYGNGPIKRIAFWRSRLSDSTLASITQ